MSGAGTALKATRTRGEEEHPASPCQAWESDDLISPPASLSVFCGDRLIFDEDGHLDFVVANAASNDLWLYRGNGDNTFQTPLVIPLTIGTNPIYIAAADPEGNRQAPTLLWPSMARPRWAYCSTKAMARSGWNRITYCPTLRGR